MPEIQSPSSQPQQPSQAAPNPASPTPPNQLSPQKPTSQSINSTFKLALLTFILGIAGGILLFITYPKFTKQPQIPAATSLNDLTLPKDAAKIQECVDYKGSLFAKPQDTPQGPVYMVYQNKVIGLEYEIDQDEFTKGKIYKDLAALNLQVNHITAGFLPDGHEGLAKPHSYIDLYLVDTKTEQAIICPSQAEPTTQASLSANLTITPISSTSPALSPVINDVSNLPKDKCPCWDGINNTCLPLSACQ